MANSIGKIFNVSLFGESHNEIIGVTISGISPGINIDTDLIKNNLTKRRPKRISESGRVEADDFEIVSGYFNGFTTGAPLTVLMYNKNVKSEDYTNIKDVYRPSHVDFPAHIKYEGYQDYRGSGHFSGRLTAPLVVAGCIALQILAFHSIIIQTHIKSVLDYFDESFDDKTVLQQIASINANDLEVINDDFENKVLALIKETNENKDSLGASLESVILNVKPGIGEPFFNKLDSVIAHYLMAIPAIKGVSFGKGFDFSNSYGSEVADEYYYDNKVKTKSNNSGGIIGGMSTGMPIIVNSVVKPAASINQELETINKTSNKKELIKIAGRHDSSIFTRMPIVVDSLLALAILDAHCIRYGYMWQRGEK